MLLRNKKIVKSRVFFSFLKKAAKLCEINVIVRDGTNDLMNVLLLLSYEKKIHYVIT